MNCIQCNKSFSLKDVIEDYLESFYSYEIMKAGAKGGILALSQCQCCKLGTFLNFYSICTYCGNTEEGPDDSNFNSELTERNVHLYAGNWWD